MEESKCYFIVRLITGKLLTFDGQCTNIDYQNPNMCLFKKCVDDGYIALAVIPYKQIRYIKRVEK